MALPEAAGAVSGSSKGGGAFVVETETSVQL